MNAHHKLKYPETEISSCFHVNISIEQNVCWKYVAAARIFHFNMKRQMALSTGLMLQHKYFYLPSKQTKKLHFMEYKR